MANLLKKIEINNPLLILGMGKALKFYEDAQTDEEIADVYHLLLNLADRTMNDNLKNLTYAMIAYSTGININPKCLINES